MSINNVWLDHNLSLDSIFNIQLISQNFNNLVIVLILFE